MGQGVPRPSHDARRHRPLGPPRHHPGDERRKLSPPRRPQPQARSRTTTSARDNQRKGLIVAQRQSQLPLSDNQKSGVKKILANYDNQHDHDLAIGRRFKLRLPPTFSSRLSRNTSIPARTGTTIAT